IIPVGAGPACGDARPGAPRGQPFAETRRFLNCGRHDTMDALSAALNSVRMTGAIFADAICTAPWGFAVPPLATLERAARKIPPGTERVVGYHLVTIGQATVRLAGAGDVVVVAGDIVILPHGDPHSISNGAPAKLLDSSAALEKWMSGDASPMEIG